MLIDDLDKLMKEMGETLPPNRRCESSHFIEGILPPTDDDDTTSIITPLEGLIEENFNGLIGDIDLPEDDLQ
ncbi:MAG: hypothetical protein J6J06_00530 [Bacteroidaceae bacterium]|nr:hypothetical protein [Bacteroidaceae bacterium]